METLMTAKDVALYTKLNVQTVYRKAKRGELPCRRIGKPIRFKKSEIDQWMQRREQ